MTDTQTLKATYEQLRDEALSLKASSDQLDRRVKDAYNRYQNAVDADSDEQWTIDEEIEALEKEQKVATRKANAALLEANKALHIYQDAEAAN